MKYLTLFTLLLFVLFTGCNPVGKYIDTVTCDETYINSSLPIALKKGEKIGIWFAATGMEKTEEENTEEVSPQEAIPAVAINIQLEDKSVYFEKIRVMPVRPMINTSYHKKSGLLEKYETLAHTYTATQDGNYSVDTKLYNARFGQEVSVVVRKKIVERLIQYRL